MSIFNIDMKTYGTRALKLLYNNIQSDKETVSAVEALTKFNAKARMIIESDHHSAEGNHRDDFDVITDDCDDVDDINTETIVSNICASEFDELDTDADSDTGSLDIIESPIRSEIRTSEANVERTSEAQTWLASVGIASSKGVNVPLFLNRILGLETAKQNHMFEVRTFYSIGRHIRPRGFLFIFHCFNFPPFQIKAYMNSLEVVIEIAKKKGEFDEGIKVMSGPNVIIRKAPAPFSPEDTLSREAIANILNGLNMSR